MDGPVDDLVDGPLKTSASRRVRVLVVTLALAYLVLEAAAWGGLHLLQSATGQGYRPVLTDLRTGQLAYLDRLLEGAAEVRGNHPVLGWTLVPGSSDDQGRINALGCRSERDYPQQPPPGVLRIAAFGDSFTFGSDVGVADAWVTRLEAALPGAEVLNFGVQGYGPDQAYLRYREHGRSVAPQVVLIGTMSENIFRTVNVFRPFYVSSYKILWTKPRFEVVGGELRLLPNPLPRLEDYERLRRRPRAVLEELGAHDQFYQLGPRASSWDRLPSVRLGKLLLARHALDDASRILAPDGTYNTASDAYRITSAVLAAFDRDCRADGVLPLHILFPSARDMQRRRSGQPDVYSALREELAEQGFVVLDLLPAFERLAGGRPISDMIVAGRGHYSPAGNAVVARAVRDFLEQRGWTSAGGRER